MAPRQGRQGHGQLSTDTTGSESSQIFTLHIFRKWNFWLLANWKKQLAFSTILVLINRNSKINCCFKGIGKLTLSSLRLQLY